jgi:maleylpyruvate isomerase
MTDARTWMRQGTKLFLDAVAELSDHAFDEPSGLPGWTRRHLVAHLHYNAEALRRLVSWAATGVEQPMYASSHARAEEIEQGALLPVSTLRELVATSAAALESDLDALPDARWAAEVRTAQGRLLPAAQIPWLRAREVTVHAVDLRAGVTFADLPEGFVAELMVDVVRKRAANDHGPELAAWLTGRAEVAPTLGPWL